MVITYMNSLPLLFSLFLVVLCYQGVFQAWGGTIGDEDLVPLRVVALVGKEWGLDCSCTIIELGEELGVAGQRTKEAQNESSET